MVLVSFSLNSKTKWTVCRECLDSDGPIRGLLAVVDPCLGVRGRNCEVDNWRYGLLRKQGFSDNPTRYRQESPKCECQQEALANLGFRGVRHPDVQRKPLPIEVFQDELSKRSSSRNFVWQQGESEGLGGSMRVEAFRIDREPGLIASYGCIHKPGPEPLDLEAVLKGFSAQGELNLTRACKGKVG